MKMQIAEKKINNANLWLSVDTLASKYPSLSPYVYCANNPIKLVDLDGMEIDWYQNQKGEVKWTDYESQSEMDKNNVEGKYLGESALIIQGSRSEKNGWEQFNKQLIGVAKFSFILKRD